MLEEYLMNESDIENNSWIKYILSGLCAIFFTLLSLQMRAQENIDFIQNQEIAELKNVIKEQEKIIIYFKMAIEQKFNRRSDSSTPSDGGYNGSGR